MKNYIRGVLGFLTSVFFPAIAENKEQPHSIEELPIQLEGILKDMHVLGMSIAFVHRIAQLD